MYSMLVNQKPITGQAAKKKCKERELLINPFKRPATHLDFSQAPQMHFTPRKLDLFLAMKHKILKRILKLKRYWILDLEQAIQLLLLGTIS